MSRKQLERKDIASVYEVPEGMLWTQAGYNLHTYGTTTPLFGTRAKRMLRIIWGKLTHQHRWRGVARVIHYRWLYDSDKKLAGTISIPHSSLTKCWCGRYRWFKYYAWKDQEAAEIVDPQQQ